MKERSAHHFHRHVRHAAHLVYLLAPLLQRPREGPCRALPLGSPFSDSKEFAGARAPELQHQRQLSRIAFLAPDLQRQILDGQHPDGLNLRTLIKSELPLAWADQRDWFERMRANGQRR